MKLLAFTDTHGSMKALHEIKKKARSAELLACCGDFTIFERNLEQMLKALNSLGRVLLIPGNHEYSQRIDRLVKKYKNIIYLHRRGLILEKVIFIGYGGGGFGVVDEMFEHWGKKVEKVLKQHRGKKTVLLLHGPPYGTKVDKVLNQQCGNKSYRRFIDRNKIDYVLCGHLHECNGKSDEIKGTKYLNPGPFGKMIDIK